MAPVHDAVLIDAPHGELEARTAQMQALMRRASAMVLGGFELRSDAKLIEAPDRFCDERGSVMRDLVQELLQQEAGAVASVASEASEASEAAA